MQVSWAAIGARQTPSRGGPAAARPCACPEVYDPTSDGRHGPATAGRPVYSGPGRQTEQRRSVVTDRRDEERYRRERKDAERREEDERRSDELKEAWRRNHPSRPEDEGGRRPKKGRA